MKKLRILSHEQATSKPQTSHEQVIKKLSHEQAINIDSFIILEFYFKEIPAFVKWLVQCSTQGQSKNIEMVQKKALKIILWNSYHNYEEAYMFSTEPLSDTCDAQCLKFIQKGVKKGLHSDIFKLLNNSRTTRNNNKKLVEYTCNRKRFCNSPLV